MMICDDEKHGNVGIRIVLMNDDEFIQQFSNKPDDSP